MPVTLNNGLTNSGIILSNVGYTDLNSGSTTCPAGSGVMMSYSVEGGSSGEVNVKCPKVFVPSVTFMPEIPGWATSVDINWG